MLFLSCEGNSYHLGFQHGRNLKALVHCAIRKHCRFFDINERPSQAVLKRSATKLEAQFPELMEEIRGIADGADCSPDDLLIYNHMPLSTGCSNLAVLHSDGPMLGHINDDVHGGTFNAAFHLRLPNGKELLHIGSAGSVGTDAGINSDGLAISHACARSAGLKNPEAILSLALLRRVLIQRSADCQEAESFLLAHSFVIRRR